MQQRIIALLDASPVDPQSVIQQQIARAAAQGAPPPPARSSAPQQQRDDGPTRVPAAVRVLMTTEEALPALQQHLTVIKVAPLRVRQSDIKSWIDFLLARLARAGWGGAKAAALVPGASRRGVRYVVRPEVYRKLQSYQFPNNLTELKVCSGLRWLLVLVACV